MYSVHALRTPNGTPDAHSLTHTLISRHSSAFYRPTWIYIMPVFMVAAALELQPTRERLSLNILRSFSFLFIFYRMEWKLILVRAVAAAVRLIQHNLMNTLFNFGASHTRPPRLVRHRVRKSTVRRYNIRSSTTNYATAHARPPRSVDRFHSPSLHPPLALLFIHSFRLDI